MTTAACPFDRTPMVPTMEKAGAEMFCLKCGRYFGLFEAIQIEATDERVRIQDHLIEMFGLGWRHGLPDEHFQPPPPVLPADDHVKCNGCGKDSGRTLEQGKPFSWYTRSDRDNGREIFACSRACIDLADKAVGQRAMVLPW